MNKTSVIKTQLDSTNTLKLKIKTIGYYPSSYLIKNLQQIKNHFDLYSSTAYVNVLGRFDIKVDMSEIFVRKEKKRKYIVTRSPHVNKDSREAIAVIKNEAYFIMSFNRNIAADVSKILLDIIKIPGVLIAITSVN